MEKSVKTACVYVCGCVEQVWEMSSSAWTSELMQEGIEHYLANDYLLTVTPSVFNYGAEVQLPSVRHAQHSQPSSSHCHYHHHHHHHNRNL